MKKIMFILFFLIITGCSVEILSPPGEPERITISPSEVTLKSGQTKIFSVKGYDRNGNYTPVYNAEWKVEGEIGIISKDGIFYAYLNNPVVSQEGYIIVQYKNHTARAHITVRVGELGIYSETYSGVIYDTVNATNNPLAVIMGIWQTGQNYVFLSNSYSDYVEGTKSLKCRITNTGGMYIKFGTFRGHINNWSNNSPVWSTNTNFLVYYNGSIEFDVKSANARDFYLKIEFASGNNFEKKVFSDILGIPFPDTEWHHVSIPLNSINGFSSNALKGVTVPFGAYATNNFPVEFFIDNVYYKPPQ